MSCGFGAVVLVFLIINHETNEQREFASDDVLSNNRQLDYQIQLEDEELEELKTVLSSLRKKASQIEAEIEETSTKVRSTTDQLKDIETRSRADQQSLEALRTNVSSLDKEVESRRSETTEDKGADAYGTPGDGDRQYLIGLRLDGKHIVIALDTSASMLDKTIVNIVRRRNQSEDIIKEAPKWQRAIRTMEWVAGNLPLDSNFQVFGFNEDASSFATNANNEWIRVDDRPELTQVIENIKNAVPRGGTSLENLVTKIATLSPPPDNVYLITDGLPTLSDRPATSGRVSGRKRVEYFREAVSKLPPQIRMNVILLPIEGDNRAASEFWSLTFRTEGQFYSPSGDWP